MGCWGLKKMSLMHLDLELLLNILYSSFSCSLIEHVEAMFKNSLYMYMKCITIKSVSVT